MNKISNKKPNNKAKAIISIVAILLVCTLSLGATTYFYKDEAYAFVTSIPGLKSLFKNAPANETDEPIIDEPIIENPDKVLNYVSTPLIVGASVDNIYVNTFEIEKIVKNCLDNNVHPSIEFSFPGYVIDHGIKRSEIFPLRLDFGTFSYYESFYHLSFPENIKENDFYLSFGNSTSRWIWDWFYSSADITLDLFYGNSYSVDFNEGFNPKYFSSDGMLLTNEILNFQGNEDISFERDFSKPISIDVLDIPANLLGSTPFKAV